MNVSELLLELQKYDLGMDAISALNSIFVDKYVITSKESHITSMSCSNTINGKLKYKQYMYQYPEKKPSDYIEYLKAFQHIPPPMEEHVCACCGFQYSAYESHILSFWELPEDWTCPECGVGKDMFEHIDSNFKPTSDSPFIDAMKQPLHVIDYDDQDEDSCDFDEDEYDLDINFDEDQDDFDHDKEQW